MPTRSSRAFRQQVPLGLSPCTHLISVGYSSPVYRYTQMKELARQPLPSAAWAVRRVCISVEGEAGQGVRRPSGPQGGSGRQRG